MWQKLDSRAVLGAALVFAVLVSAGCRSPSEVVSMNNGGGGVPGDSSVIAAPVAWSRPQGALPLASGKPREVKP